MLEFEHVTYSRRNPDGVVPVLRDISFWTHPGKVLAVLGPSGGGKSTLLRLACRLMDPDEGSIVYNGKDVREHNVLELRRKVSMVFQEPTLFGETVEENLLFAADPAAAKPQLENPGVWLERVGLSAELLDRRPDALSVGQRQRVALARALIPEPELLLLDEPTSALDPRAATSILNLIRHLRDSHHLTVIIVTHVVEHARQVADRLLFLKDGTVLEEGGTHLFLAPEQEETRAFLAGEEE